MNKYSIPLYLILIFSLSRVNSQSVEIIVNPDSTITDRFIGNGAQWAAYPHCDTKNEAKGFTYGPISEEDYHLVEKRLLAMHPQFMRIMIHTGWRYFNGLDKNGEPILDFENEEQKWLYRILDFCQDNDITVLFGEWVPRSHKTDGKSGGKWINIWDNYNETWAKMIADHLHYLLRIKNYSCIKYYDIENEAYLKDSFSEGDFDKYIHGFELLNNELVRRGLRDEIKLDCSWGHFENVRDINPEQIRRIAEFADIYDEHHYMESIPEPYTDYAKDVHEQINELKENDPDFDGFFLGECNFKIQGLNETVPNTGQDHSKVVFQWENGVYMANVTVQAMNAGILGVIAWDVDDAMHTQDDEGIQLKRWGFWDIMGEEYSNEPELEKVRPWAYAWTLLCKYFPTGMQILKVSVPDKTGIYAAAGMINGKYSIIIVNQNPDFKNVALKVKEDNTSRTFNKYVYFKGEMPKDSLGFPIPQQELSNVNLDQGLNLIFTDMGVILLTEIE